MNGQTEKQTHEIRIGMRKEMSITGVKEVVSFDENCVALKSTCGEMSIEGSALKVGTLDTDRGIVTLDGKIDAVYYTVNNEEEKRGFFSKIFR